MTCIKHSDPIIKFCQTCSVFACSKCPSHLYHVTTEFSLFKLQFRSEIDSFTKLIQAKEKMLEALEAKLTGYISSVATNTDICIENLKKIYETLSEALKNRYLKLTSEVMELSVTILKPLQGNLERTKGYLQEASSLIISSEKIYEKLGDNLLNDPLQISNELRKININNFHYIDTFIKVTKSALDTDLPKIPIVELNLKPLDECLFLDYNSKLLEFKPLFPYWNLDRLLSTLKVKDHGASVSSKTDNWATAIFKETFTCGKVSVEFSIQKDASGNKMYIGMISNNTPGLSLTKSLSSTCGHAIWAYRICGEMHSKNFIHTKFKEKRRYRRGDIVRVEADLDRNLISFYRNSQEMYTFTDVTESLQPFVCFGEAFQCAQIISCEYSDPTVVFH